MTDKEALRMALEALEGIHPGNMTPMAEEYWNKAITAIKQALAAPTVQEPVAWIADTKRGYNTVGYECKKVNALPHGTMLYTIPPAAPELEGRDWSLLEATQESLREHMVEIKRLKAAQPDVPDALTSADIQENIEYVAGWNDCRAAMLEILKARGNT
jgi:hypothetical protein